MFGMIKRVKRIYENYVENKLLEKVKDVLSSLLEDDYTWTYNVWYLDNKFYLSLSNGSHQEIRAIDKAIVKVLTKGELSIIVIEMMLQPKFYSNRSDV